MTFAIKMLEMLTSAYNRTDIQRLGAGKAPVTNVGKLFYLAGWGFDLISLQMRRMEQWNDIDEISGEELDRLGANFGAARSGMDDGDFRISIKTRLMRKDSGTLDGVIHGAAALFAIQEEQIEAEELYPAKVRLIICDDDLEAGYFERAGMIRKMLKKIAAAGVRIEIRLRLYTYVREDIVHGNRVRFQTCFYPRFNLPHLKLDRTWKLNGNRKLSGYNSRETVDLYPVSVGFQTAAEGTPEEGVRVHLQTGAGVREWIGSQAGILTRAFAACDVASDQSMSVRIEAAEVWEERARLRLRECAQQKAEARERLRVSVSVPCKTVPRERQIVRTSVVNMVEAGEIRVYNKNRLDGRFQLNGGRKLNGGTELR